MESRYKVLKNLKDIGLFTKLVSSGIISIDVASKMYVYEEYLKLYDGYNKAEAMKVTSKNTRVSVSYLYVIIKYMK